MGVELKEGSFFEVAQLLTEHLEYRLFFQDFCYCETQGSA